MAVTIFIAIIFLAVVLFIFLGFPMWMIVDCAIASSRKNLSKALWIVSMLLTWTLGAIIYGLFASRKKAAQWTAGVVLVVGVLGIVLFVRSLFYVADLASREALKRVETIQVGVLTQEDLDQLKTRLTILARENQDGQGLGRIRAFKDTLKNITITQIFLKMQEDGTLTPTEYQIWIEKFDTRKTQDPDELKAFLDAKGWQ